MKLVLRLFSLKTTSICNGLATASTSAEVGSSGIPTENYPPQAKVHLNSSFKPAKPNLESLPGDFRFVFPDFLPDGQFDRRNKLREKLERLDMLRRRMHLELPEFYVGSILAVTVSDPLAPGRINRFVGLCIQRYGAALRHYFTLRNSFEGMGVEVRYELYNPLIQKVEVLKLEKRLDNDLTYLRDALPEFSVVPMDMEAVPHPVGAPVPVNPIKVKLRPPPWCSRWELRDLQGIEDAWTLVTPWYKKKFARTIFEPWKKYDLIGDYRKEVPREDQQQIYEEILEFEKVHGVAKHGRRRTMFKNRERSTV